MKLHVVYNRSGEIVGAARLDGASAIRARPVADEKEGHKEAVVYVPANFLHYDLGAICQRLRVDMAGKSPELKPKD